MKKSIRNLLSTAILAIPLISCAQENGGNSEKGIIIHQDPRLPVLSARFKQEQGNVKLRGYKVQIYFGDRGKATEMKGEFLQLFPDMPADIDYLAPNFRVRVGNFRSHMEAENFLRRIKPTYTGAYVVTDNIALPRL